MHASGMKSAKQENVYTMSSVRLQYPSFYGSLQFVLISVFYMPRIIFTHVKIERT